MRNVTITRFLSTDKSTLGSIEIEGVKHLPIFTLENPWLGNKPFLSRIPAGWYCCKPFSGNKYKAVYEITDVRDRSYILFHSGNTAKDTSGCILLGMKAGSLSKEPAVLQSKKAIKYFKSLIGDKPFNIRIK